MKNLITINEVDCYIGNAWRINRYSTHRAVQHQILINDTPLGRRNMVADDDRGERVVVTKEVPQKFVDFFKEADKLCWDMKSEHCKTMEEFNEAAEFNKPIRKEIDGLIEKMHAIESLDLTFEEFKKILMYI